MTISSSGGDNDKPKRRALPPRPGALSPSGTKEENASKRSSGKEEAAPPNPRVARPASNEVSAKPGTAKRVARASTGPTTASRKQPAPPPPPPKERKRLASASIQIAGEEHADREAWWKRLLEWRRWLPGWLGSLIVHSILILILALIFVSPRSREVLSLSGSPDADDVGKLEQLEFQTPNTPLLSEDLEGFDSPLPSVVSGALMSEAATDAPLVPEAKDVWSQIRGAQLDAPSGLPAGGGIEGRAPDRRAETAMRRGATEESEAAVEAGLAWLAAHQRPNGAWWFDHSDGPCNGRCSHHGTSGCSTAATGLALLAFLGAGYTADTGPYQQEVRDGVYYLLSRARINQFGADLQEGTMYGQGIAAMALCEAYAMTGDEAIKPIAQKAIDFIVNAQHKAGGWRYNPKQPGDTTVTGWQFMALKSAVMAGLEVPTPTLHLAQVFLDSVQTGQGAYYGYFAPGKEPTPTAIGLLCRMYSGWSRDRDALGMGVEYLFELAPSKTDMYFDYYATLVMSHYSGQSWDPWNRTMRDYLVKQQSQRGHESGSWYFSDKHGDQGGRLYNTAMAIMILEVYYRYMPLYGDDALNSPW